MTKLPTPLEDVEDEMFANYLRARGFLFSHIANETSIKNWGYLSKMKRIGKNSGVPDFIVIIPDKNGAIDKLVFVEMKRQGATNCAVSEAQGRWLAQLNMCNGVVAEWCAGADEAIKFIERMEKIQ